MKTLGKKNFNFVGDVPIKYINFIIIISFWEKIRRHTFIPPPVHYNVAPSIKNYLSEDVIFIPFGMFEMKNL